MKKENLTIEISSCLFDLIRKILDYKSEDSSRIARPKHEELPYEVTKF